MGNLNEIDDYEGKMEIRNVFSAVSGLTLLSQLEIARDLLQGHISTQIDNPTEEPQIILASAIVEFCCDAIKKRPKMAGIRVKKIAFDR